MAADGGGFPVAFPPVEFAKGGSQRSAVNIPDTVSTKDTLEILLGICEGPIKGLVDGPRSYYLDTTALVAPDSKPNFSNFQLTMNIGSDAGEDISSRLGGFGSSANVSVALAYGVPVIRSGFQINLDFIEARFVIQQLMTSNSQGQSQADLDIKVEYRPTAGGAWVPAYSATPIAPLPSSTPGDGTSQTWIVRDTGTVGLFSFEGDIPTTSGPTAPPAPPGGAGFWWDTVHSVGKYWDPDTLLWTTRSQGILGAGHWWMDSPYNGDIEYYDSTITTPPGNAPAGSVWRQPDDSVLIWNGQAWVQATAAITELSGGNVTAVDGVIHLHEKISSATVKELRFPVPRISGTYDIRVTKLSPDATTERLESVVFESFQEIRNSIFNFPNTATIQLVAQASDQFTRIPTFQGVAEGAIVKVPSNFDPETRVYTGVWDGTFQMAYTNSLPWLTMHAVENNRWGMSVIYQHYCNKWTVYEWAQWCDAMVDDGMGGTRPRVTYNEYIKDPRSAKEFVNFMAGAGFARMVDDGNGFVDFLIDKPSSPVALFTPENVADGKFTYGYTDKQARPNDIVGRFYNEGLFYARDARRATNDADIATYGRITTEFEAQGCTNVSELEARIRYRLITGQTEKEIVNFKTNRKGLYLRPWDIILVADAEMGYGLSGRVKTVSGAREITLRDMISLEAGFTYVATFDLVNPAYPATSTKPFTTERRTITSAPGEHYTLTFDSDLPVLAELAVFAIEAAGDIGTPKPYRLLQITSAGAEPDVVELQALEVNTTKWDYIDGTVPAVTAPTYSNIFSPVVKPPTALKITVKSQQLGGKTTRNASLSWTRSETKWVRRYRVLQSTDGAPYAQIGEVTDPVLDFKLGSGTHRFQVIAVTHNAESQPVVAMFDTLGLIRPVPAVANLALVGGLTSTTYDVQEPSFMWETPTHDPDFDYWRVQIGSAIRTEEVRGQPFWTYSLQDQKTDGGGTPARSITIHVASVDLRGNVSPVTSLTVTNAAPATITGATVVGVPGGVTLNIPAPIDRDYAGTKVWVSATPGFDPLVIAPTYDAQQTAFHIPATTNRYIRFAHYDYLSSAPSGLNISAEFTVTPAAIAVGTITGLGPGATAAAADVLNAQLSSIGVNLVRNSRFELGSTGLAGFDFSWGASSTAPVMSRSGVAEARKISFSTPNTNASTDVICGIWSWLSGAYIPVVPGARYAVGVRLRSKSGVTNVVMPVMRMMKGDFSASVNQFPTHSQFTDANGSASAVDEMAWQYCTAPADAGFAYWEIYGFKTSAGVTGAAAFEIDRPVIMRIPPGQTVAPTWVPSNDSFLGADVTLVNTAAAITGQGALATLSTVTASVLAAGVGKNCILDGDFRQPGATYWDAGPNASVGTAASVRYKQTTATGYAIGGTLYTQSYFVADQCPCVPGDRIEVSAYLGGTNVSPIQVFVGFRDSAGAYITTTLAGSSTSIGAANGDLSTYTRVGGFVTAPANAKQAYILCYAYATTASPTFRVAKPYIGKATAAQTELTPWNIGFEAVPGADITLVNTAAAITGQGDLATTNRIQLPFGQNSLINSDWTINTTGWAPMHGASSAGTLIYQEGRNYSGYGGNPYHALWTRLVRTDGPNLTASQYCFGWCQKGFNSEGLATLQQWAMPVVAGDRVYFGGRFSVHGGTTVVARVRWWSAAGTMISEVDASITVVDARLGGPTGANGDPANYTLCESIATAPTNARYATWGTYWYYTGTGVDTFLFQLQPNLARLPAGQTAVIGYTPGPVDRAADQTLTNTAAAITGQGDLATTNAAVLPFGTNGLTNTEFALSTTYPPHGYVASGTGDLTGVTQTASIVTAGPRRAVKSIMTGTVSAGTYFDLFYGHYADVPNARRFQLPVVAGDRIGASVLVAKNAAVSQIYVNVQWLDAAGAYVGETAGSAVTATANGDTGNPADYALSTLVATAPTNARFVNLFVRCLPVASAVNATGWGMSPMLCRIPAGQTVVPPYTPGPVDRAADQTLTNTAAAITGQGPGATAIAADVMNVNVASPYLNADAQFQSTWTNGAYPPAGLLGWANWSNGHRNNCVAGLVGPKAVEFVCPDTLDTGWSTSYGRNGTYGWLNPGWYVLEVDVYLVSGSLRGAGAYGGFYNAGFAALQNDYRIDFWVDADVNGVVNNGASPTTGQMYRYRKLVRGVSSTINNGNLYAMANWGGFGGAAAVKTIQFHRIGLRPASDSEKASQAVLNVNGGISGAFTANPITSTTSTSITMAAVTWSNPFESISLPSATLSGLSPSTRYYVFRDLVSGTYDPTSTYATAITRLNDQTRRWLMCGYVTLPGSGGGGGGGGGGGFIP